MTRNKKHQCLQGPELPEIYPNSPAKTPPSVSPVLHLILHTCMPEISDWWSCGPGSQGPSLTAGAQGPARPRFWGKTDRGILRPAWGTSLLTSKGHSEKDVSQAARVVRPSTSLERHPTPRHSVSASGLTSPSEGGSATQRKKKPD